MLSVVTVRSSSGTAGVTCFFFVCVTCFRVCVCVCCLSGFEPVYWFLDNASTGLMGVCLVIGH